MLIDGVDIGRDENGVARVVGRDLTQLIFGLGFCHAQDRGLQMLLMRILGRGRASEQLDGSDATLAVDLFFRRMHWSGGAADEVQELDGGTRELVTAYCSGANAAFRRKLPWELRALGYRHEPWTGEDCVLVARLLGYVTLAQSQAEIERWLVELVQLGIGRDKLAEIFPDLSDLDEALLRQVKLGERIVPEALFSGSAAPRMMASNNWVVAPKKSASGHALLANDPHLEGNRLPAVWYETVLQAGDRYLVGASIPGLPTATLGRTRELAWGATYTFMDTVDSWIERCKDGCYQRDGAWHPFSVREEIIERKGKPPYLARFYENHHGVLDGDPQEEGLYLTTRWSAAHSGARSMTAALALWDATSVEAGMAQVGRIETTWNWVLADRAGNIGYQMSGLMPKRRPGANGFVPLPGWDSANDWQGFVPPEELPRSLNPEEGFIVTANQDLNRLGKAKPINMPMGDYRARRIAALLAAKPRLELDDMTAAQGDVHSLEAEELMAVLRPLLPDTEQGRLLATWDLRYDPDSRGAFLFEHVRRALLVAVFGGSLGEAAVAYLLDESGIFIDFYQNFSRVLLREHSAWFGDRTCDELYRPVIAQALGIAPRPWGSGQKMMLSHVLFGGKLPRFLGFDRGPVTVKGGRATPHQGQIYRSGGRATSFVPSFRFVTDLGVDDIRSCLLGGPSDRRFSRWYASEITAWVEGAYKRVAPST